MTDKDIILKLKGSLEELRAAKYGNVIDSIYNMITGLETLIKDLEKEMKDGTSEPERIIKKRKDEPVKRSYKKRKATVSSQ